MSALDDLKVGDIFTVSHAIEVDILLNISIQQNTRIKELEAENLELRKPVVILGEKLRQPPEEK